MKKHTPEPKKPEPKKPEPPEKKRHAAPEKTTRRQSNDDLYQKAPQLEPGTETAVSAAMALYPQLDAKALTALFVGDDSGTCHVEIGYKTGDSAVHIVEVSVDASGLATQGEELPNVPPGHAKT